MKLIKHIRNQILFVGFVAAAGYIAYQTLLDDEAKRQLRELRATTMGSYDRLSGLINQRIGTIMDEDLVAQNRQKIRDMWADLGY